MKETFWVNMGFLAVSGIMIDRLIANGAPAAHLERYKDICDNYVKAFGADALSDFVYAQLEA